MWLGSRIGFLAETGTDVTITAWSTIFFFAPSIFLLAFALSLSVSFPLPAVFMPASSSPTVRVAPSAQQRSVLLEYVHFPFTTVQ